MMHSPKFLEAVQKAKKQIKEVTIDEVATRLNAGEKLYLVDVREDEEWAKGHIQGATHIGKGVLERDIERKIPDTTAEIVLYCGGGFRSALAAESLQKMGYTNVASMDGGWRGWKTKELPIE